jgi:hypothetical protein
MPSCPELHTRPRARSWNFDGGAHVRNRGCVGGTGSLGPRAFQHADRRPYGEDDLLATAKATLRQLGYSAAEAKRAADEVWRAASADERRDLERLLRACLRACPVRVERYAC